MVTSRDRNGLLKYSWKSLYDHHQKTLKPRFKTISVLGWNSCGFLKCLRSARSNLKKPAHTDVKGKEHYLEPQSLQDCFAVLHFVLLPRNRRFQFVALVLASLKLGARLLDFYQESGDLSEKQKSGGQRLDQKKGLRQDSRTCEPITASVCPRRSWRNTHRRRNSSTHATMLHSVVFVRRQSKYPRKREVQGWQRAMGASIKNVTFMVEHLQQIKTAPVITWSLSCSRSFSDSFRACWTL